jgi:hypothetical protein
MHANVLGIGSSSDHRQMDFGMAVGEQRYSADWKRRKAASNPIVQTHNVKRIAHSSASRICLRPFAVNRDPELCNSYGPEARRNARSVSVALVREHERRRGQARRDARGPATSKPLTGTGASDDRRTSAEPGCERSYKVLVLAVHKDNIDAIVLENSP